MIKLVGVFDSSGIVKGFTKVSRATSKVGKEVSNLGDRLKKIEKFKHFSSLLTGLKGIASATTSIATGILSFLSAFTVSFLTINSSLEQLEVLLRTATGSSEASAKAMKDIFQFAETAPFSIDSITDSFVKLKASGIDPMGGTLRTLADSVAAFGGGSEQLKLVTIAIQQMVGKGVISMEELRRQFAEQVPTAMYAMARGLGITYQELSDLVKTGTLDTKKALAAMLPELDKLHGGAAKKRMDTFKGALALISNEWKKLVRFIGTSEGAFDSITTAIKKISEALTVFRGSAAGVKILSDISGSIRKSMEGLTADPTAILMSFKQIGIGATKMFSVIANAFSKTSQVLKAAGSAIDYLSARAKKNDAESMFGISGDVFDNFSLKVQLNYEKVAKELLKYQELANQKSGVEFSDYLTFWKIPEEEVTNKIEFLKRKKDELRKIINEKINSDDTSFAGVIDSAANDFEKYMDKLIEGSQKSNSLTWNEQIGIAYDKLISEFATYKDAVLKDIAAMQTRYDEYAEAVSNKTKMITDLQLSFSQSLRETWREGLTSYQAYADKFKEIREYEGQASSARTDEEKLRYLNEALKVANSLRTTEVKSENGKQLLVSKQKTINLKYRNQQRIQEQILAIHKKEKRALEENKKAIGKKLEATRKDFESMESKVEELKVQLAETAGGFEAMGGTALDQFSQMQESASKYLATLKDINNTASSSVSSPSRRALGGSVKSSQQYIVGEKGPELFIPNNFGTVVPNNKLNQGATGKVVTINLSLNNSSPVTVTGTEKTVDQLTKMFEERKRYAA